MGYRAVSFDMGHTLVFPRYEVYQELLGIAGAGADREAMEAMEGRLRGWFDDVVRQEGLREGIWTEYYKRFFAGLDVPEEKMREVLLELRDRHVEGVGLWIEPAPEAEEALEGVRERGLKVISISNNDGRLRRMVEYQGWEDRFDLLVDSEDVGVSKPDPGIFRAALEGLGIEAEELLHVGDYYSVDVEGARNAGVRGVLYDPIRSYETVDCPRITRLGQVLELLDSPEAFGAPPADREH
ncbi:MAG: HAD-IA family hydrolase [bacterium]